MPWRRRSTVRKVLGDLAKRYEVGWLTSNRDRLEAEIVDLTQQRDLLQQRVARLEATNKGLLQALLGKHGTLETDRQTLEELDRELDEAEARLQLVA